MSLKLTVSLDLDPTGRYLLHLVDWDDAIAAIFEERELQGGGYTWEGIVQALIEMRMPEALDDLDIGAEADNMYAYSSDRDLLERVADLMREAAADHALLIAAIEHAGDDLE
jgi:ribulose 1,5-bisphosphate synthetase/thiazole synthase